MNAGLLEKIRRHGHWRVNFQPLAAESQLSVGRARELVQGCAVSLRGWDYPYASSSDRTNGGIENNANFSSGWVDWVDHIEFWRLYESQQFLGYRALSEDWQDARTQAGLPALGTRQGEWVGVLGLVYQLTEIFEFLSRLMGKDVYTSGVRVAVTLINVRGRTLFIESVNRAPFLAKHQTQAEEIRFEKEYGRDEVLAVSADLALDAIVYFVDKFGWSHPPIETLRKDQQDLLAKRQ